MDKNHYMDVVFIYQRNNDTKCWILILFWITLCWISWPIYHLGIKARAVFESTETGQFKNAQDSVPRPPGSWEIAQTKVGHVFLEPCISNYGRLFQFKHFVNKFSSWSPDIVCKSCYSCNHFNLCKLLYFNHFFQKHYARSCASHFNNFKKHFPDSFFGFNKSCKDFNIC